MPKTPKKKLLARVPDAGGTAGLLAAAAMEEFNQYGYGGTDTNKIARRAGFAPQTFYRQFSDKTAIFLAVYRKWEDEEMAAIGTLQGRSGAVRQMAAAIVEHHRAHLGFRRSLRQLACEVDAVRAARAASRKRQVAHICAWLGPAAVPRGQIAMTLLQIERISDAIAEGEMDDLGVDETTAQKMLARLIGGMWHGARKVAPLKP